MKKLFTIALTLCIPFTAAVASENADTTKVKVKAEAKTTKFKGAPILRVFTNFQQGLFSANEMSSFNLDRAELGYGATFGDGFASKIAVDFGATKTVDGKTERAIYLRNAEVSWEKKGFKVNMGLISLKQFSTSENAWGYRYVAKSAQDAYKFGTSRDYGFTLAYKINDWVSVDATMVNGEGYKKAEFDNKFKYAIGATFKPVKGLTMRVYGDIYSKSDGLIDARNQQTLALFAGYEHSAFSVGAEYDHMWNTKFNKGVSQSIISVFGSAKLHKQVKIYARYDNYSTKNNWGDDQEAYYLGVQYTPVKYVKISPSFSYKKVRNQTAVPIVGLFLDIKF